MTSFFPFFVCSWIIAFAQQSTWQSVQSRVQGNNCAYDWPPESIVVEEWACIPPSNSRDLCDPSVFFFCQNAAPTICEDDYGPGYVCGKVFLVENPPSDWNPYSHLNATNGSAVSPPDPSDSSFLPEQSESVPLSSFPMSSPKSSILSSVSSTVADVSLFSTNELVQPSYSDRPCPSESDFYFRRGCRLCSCIGEEEEVCQYIDSLGCPERESNCVEETPVSRARHSGERWPISQCDQAQCLDGKIEVIRNDLCDNTVVESIEESQIVSNASVSSSLRRIENDEGPSDAVFIALCGVILLLLLLCSLSSLFVFGSLRVAKRRETRKKALASLRRARAAETIVSSTTSPNNVRESTSRRRRGSSRTVIPLPPSEERPLPSLPLPTAGLPNAPSRPLPEFKRE